jgi:hypothetical protein
MAGSWALLARIAKNKWSKKNEEVDRPRIDGNLPLELKIGSRLSIMCPSAIIAGDKLNMKVPLGELSVVSYGTFTIYGFKGYRFYLSTDSQELFTLQVVLNQKGEIDDLKLYSLHDEITAIPKDGWDFWLNDHDGYIGYSIFDLKDGTRYFRAWDNETEQEIVAKDDDEVITHIPPVRFEETVHEDPYGDKRHRVTHLSMLYGRDATDSVAEFMMVSVADDQDGASVQILLGLGVAPIEVKKVY